VNIDDHTERKIFMNSSEMSTEPIFGIEDDRIERELDVENFNQRSVYNVPGYQPVKTELRHAPVSVSGTLPPELNGVYLRNGSNVQFDRPRSRLHPFNGAGMLHQVQIKDGAASYSNTYIRTPRFDFEQQTGREAFLTFSDMAGGGRAGLERMQLIEAKKRKGLIPNLSMLESSTASTSVQFHAGTLYCFNETGFPFALNASTVEGRLVLDGTGHLETWGGALQSPFSAHPRIDPESGTFYNLSIDRIGGGVYCSRLKDGQLANHRRIHQQDMEAGGMAYLHDYVLTEKYLVFADTSLRSLRSRMLGDSGSPYFFDPDYKLRWGVLPRDGNEVVWFETSNAGFLWHMVNGWETSSAQGHPQIVLYAPVFSSYAANIPIHTPEESHALLTRWVLDLATGQVVEDRRLLDHGYERPSINLRYSGRPQRYAYLLDEQTSGYMGQGVLKYDLLEEKPVKAFDYGDFLGGEALFVPTRDGVDEDDGYLIDLLMDDTRADMLVIDAKTMEEVARLHLPTRVPFGVHACWLDEAKLSRLHVDAHGG